MPSSGRTIAITGAAGQLGSELTRLFGARAAPLNRQSADLTRPESLRRAILPLEPEVVINCAAYTAVDRAEQERDLCFAINAHGVEAFARICDEAGALLVQISSDYVFSGGSAPPPPSADTPHRETDPTDPQGVYAKSKLAGERAAATCGRHLVVRTCGLYSPPPPTGPVRGRNFPDTMLVLARQLPRLRVVDDQTCTPTYVPHLAEGLKNLIGAGATGLIHLTSGGATTWHGFATRLLCEAGLATPIDPITTADFAAPAPRPRYSVLDCGLAELKYGVRLPDWQDGVKAYLGAAVLPAD